ncbi:unnamed protein product [Fusarium langsethiae]|nr:unnamed protein product [Fusarium langsethiae]
MQPGLAGQQLLDCCPRTRYHDLAQALPGRRHAARSSKRSFSGSAPDALATVDSSNHSHQQQRHSTIMSQVAPRHRAWVPRHSTISQFSKSILVALLIALHAVSPAYAVRIPFTNCLSDAYRLHEPTRLQWVPLYADAVFDIEDEKHSLRVIVWGNVTGARTTSQLPSPGDPSWNDDDKINGKIDELPQSGYRTATTYFPRVNFLTYAPYNERFNFCNTSLVNGTCPLGPYFGEVDYSDAYKLPSINITWDAYASYAFASLAPSMSIVDGTKDAPQIGCVSMAITPDLGGLSWLLKILPMIVLLFTGFAVVFSAIFSPWGSTDVFHWTSNYGRDVDLLRLVTPGFGDCLQYIQFIALSGGLTLDYPGFYQPIVSQMAWSTLMFNESFVADAPSWQSVVDGIYVTNATYGLQELGQLVGMAESQDIWAGMMVWLCVCIASVTVLVQGGFAVQWLSRKINNTPEEDLRSKNVPFSVGNAVRIVFNYFLLPIVALSCFQLVTAGDSPTYTIALAVVTLIFLIIFASYLFYLIIRTRPKSVLYDDLPTVLLYGPLYNTYSDEAAAFALIPVFLTFLRGITVGAVQPSGIAQVVLLAICEVIHILTIHAFRPFQRSTAMNAYHTLFGSLRLVSILLMVAFVPTLDVSEGNKGWIGYIILGLHGTALIFGFFLNALQTIIEVTARMLGAGGDDARGLTRGGLTKIFGARQLSRRNTQHRNTGPSRASQLSTAAMLDLDDGGKSGYVMPSGRVRSESGASLGGLMNPRHRSSSALDSIDVYSSMPHNIDSSSSYMPNTPGERSTFSFLPSPNAARHHPTQSMDAADPYYRPPRRRREATNGSIHSEGPGASSPPDMKRISQPGGLGDPADMGADISRGPTPAPPPPAGYSQVSIPPNRPDYATREVDFYYGVRGPALNSDGPGRKLGTGPADPTGPVATASGWFRTLLGGKTKEKGKGFEVVRSSRMPPAMMARNGGESPPEGIPVAMGVLRNGPIDSDDEDEPQPRRSPGRQPQSALLDDNGDPQDSEPDSPVLERPQRTFSVGSESVPREPNKSLSKAPHIALREAEDDDAPEIPRKSSKRASGHFAGSSDHSHSRAPSLNLMNMPGSTISFDSQWRDADAVSRVSSHHRATLSGSSRLPFERTNSQKRLSSNSSIEFPGEFSQINFGPSIDERPASFGMVSQHGVSRVDPLHRDVDLLGSSAELVEDPPARPRT